MLQRRQRTNSEIRKLHAKVNKGMNVLINGKIRSTFEMWKRVTFDTPVSLKASRVKMDK